MTRRQSRRRNDTALPPPKTKRQRQAPDKESTSVAEDSGDPGYNAKIAHRNDFVDLLVHCRDVQLKQILPFLSSRVERNSGGALFFSGPPGSGKTYLVQQLAECAKKHSVFSPVVYINCLMCSNVNQLISQLCKELKIKPSVAQSFNHLKKKLAAATSRPSLIILDEADHFLKYKNSDHLMEIFDLAMVPNSSTVVIGITNVVDLYEKVISNTLNRANPCALSVKFSPYTKDDLVTLLQLNVDKLVAGSDIEIEKEAVVWCANRFSSCSGDFRDAIHACELAIEAARRSNQKLVRVIDICQIVMSATSSSMTDIQYFRLPLNQRLVAAVIAFMQEESDSFNLADVLAIVRKLCAALEEQLPSDDEFWYNVNALVDQGIVALHGSKTLKAKVTLTTQRLDMKRKIEANPFLALVNTVLNKINLKQT